MTARGDTDIVIIRETRECNTCRSSFGWAHLLNKSPHTTNHHLSSCRIRSYSQTEHQHSLFTVFSNYSFVWEVLPSKSSMMYVIERTWSDFPQTNFCPLNTIKIKRFSAVTTRPRPLTQNLTQRGPHFRTFASVATRTDVKTEDVRPNVMKSSSEVQKEDTKTEGELWFHFLDIIFFMNPKDLLFSLFFEFYLMLCH